MSDAVTLVQRVVRVTIGSYFPLQVEAAPFELEPRPAAAAPSRLQ